jgi:hypothetical protein
VVRLILAVAGLTPLELPPDVFVYPSASFRMPVTLDRPPEVARVRFFVSTDRGRTWQHLKDAKPTDEKIAFAAPRDDLYWFALQVENKDGRRTPESEELLTPSMKVFVNTAKRAVRVEKSYAELRQEAADLRQTVEKLRRRLAAAGVPLPAPVFYTEYFEGGNKVQLSDEMAAKVVEVLAGQSKPFQRTVRVLPRGRFLVGDKTYYLYGDFITSDPGQGVSWADPAFGRFWDELNRVKDDVGRMNGFKP